MFLQKILAREVFSLQAYRRSIAGDWAERIVWIAFVRGKHCRAHSGKLHQSHALAQIHGHSNENTPRLAATEN
jgi:hypothetical protein